MKKKYESLEIDILRLRLADLTNSLLSDILNEGEGEDDGGFDAGE